MVAALDMHSKAPGVLGLLDKTDKPAAGFAVLAAACAGFAVEPAVIGVVQQDSVFDSVNICLIKAPGVVIKTFKKTVCSSGEICSVESIQ